MVQLSPSRRSVIREGRWQQQTSRKATCVVLRENTSIADILVTSITATKIIIRNKSVKNNVISKLYKFLTWTLKSELVPVLARLLLGHLCQGTVFNSSVPRFPIFKIRIIKKKDPLHGFSLDTERNNPLKAHKAKPHIIVCAQQKCQLTGTIIVK